MAGIRWGRGFFRVWMLIAIVWIGVGVIAGGNSILNPYVSKQILAVPTATSQLTMYMTLSPEHIELMRLETEGTIVATEVRDGFKLYTPADSESDRRQRTVAAAQTIVDEYVAEETTTRRSQALPTVLGWTFLPPLFLLVAGWAIGWAISGFRRSAA